MKHSLYVSWILRRHLIKCSGDIWSNVSWVPDDIHSHATWVPWYIATHISQTARDLLLVVNMSYVYRYLIKCSLNTMWHSLHVPWVPCNIRPHVAWVPVRHSSHASWLLMRHLIKCPMSPQVTFEILVFMVSAMTEHTNTHQTFSVLHPMFAALCATAPNFVCNAPVKPYQDCTDAVPGRNQYRTQAEMSFKVEVHAHGWKQDAAHKRQWRKDREWADSHERWQLYSIRFLRSLCWSHMDWTLEAKFSWCTSSYDESLIMAPRFEFLLLFL